MEFTAACGDYGRRNISESRYDKNAWRAGFLWRGPVCACIGYFDGLHRGHRALIDETIRRAKAAGCDSALITFSPDPWITIGKMQKVQHLTTLEQRIELAGKMGIDRVIVLDFVKEMAELSPQAFIDMLAEHCRLKVLVCGFDFHYGKFGSGSVETLRAEADKRFDVVVIAAVNDQGDKISSSRICRCLERGDVAEAGRLLGYPYEIRGVVVHGRQNMGREWGFPTANLKTDEETLMPLGGVYAGEAESKGRCWKAMINIGHNPDLQSGSRAVGRSKPVGLCGRFLRSADAAALLQAAAGRAAVRFAVGISRSASPGSTGRPRGCSGAGR